MITAFHHFITGNAKLKIQKLKSKKLNNIINFVRIKVEKLMF